jgi:hypothetical protein
MLGVLYVVTSDDKVVHKYDRQLRLLDTLRTEAISSTVYYWANPLVQSARAYTNASACALSACTYRPVQPLRVLGAHLPRRQRDGIVAPVAECRFTIGIGFVCVKTGRDRIRAWSACVCTRRVSFRAARCRVQTALHTTW